MKRKFFIPVMLMLITSITAGCANGITLSTNNNTQQNIVRKLEVETKSISDDNEALESSIKLPVFSNDNNKEILDEINTIIEEDALKIKEEMSQMAENDFKDAKKSNIELRKYELLINYEVHTANNNLISVTTLNYQYTGGAHGMSVKVLYNFDLTTGKEIALGDFFKEGSNYKKVINEEIQKQIKENPDKFFPDEVELFSGISDDQSFFIKDGKLFIYFGQYDIAPYSSGIIEFEIPSSVLKDVVSSSFIK
ncbi:DUF3298 and DUF4163 domain-containing protein [Alkaliphilus sp. MSJ-5]|uniref:DUF3298 and DUF4163 domain-containing protein n=1 Tax=Alkaliphilus flagellatus TaxID=2841507 RepID=A0ABS6G0Z4_9FIRM|nr:DUF3298 and DUF4163 domain-containing protein [Alkaliphilus flagellatus]MBU5676167.1 DUF3298 and DUF4163 domain-containing protein [Alkaliphilus flagellatus]